MATERITVGFDPGTARLGFGVVIGEDPVEVLDFGVIETAPKDAMPARLVQLYDGVGHILRAYRPTDCAIERLFFARNVTTALTVGQARGVVLLAVAQVGIPVVEYTPAEIKQAVAGWGKADKPQMQEMVRLLLRSMRCRTPTTPPMRWRWRCVMCSSPASTAPWPARSRARGWREGGNVSMRRWLNAVWRQAGARHGHWCLPEACW